MLANAGEHVLEITPLGGVVADLIGGDERYAGQTRKLRESRQPNGVGRFVVQRGGEIAAVGEDAAVAAQGRRDGGTQARRELQGLRCVVGVVGVVGEVRFVLFFIRYDEGEQAGAEFGDVAEVERALALGRAQSTAGDQARKPRVGGAVGREQHNRGSIERREFGADQQVQLMLLRGHVGPHDAGQRVAVGDGQGRVAEFGGTLHQLFGVRRAAEKREVGEAVEFGVSRGGRDGWVVGHGGDKP